MKTNHRYNLLKSPVKKRAYSQILDAIKSFDTQVTLSLVNPKEAMKLYFDVYFDYPELFYASPQLGYGGALFNSMLQLKYIYSNSEIIRRQNIINRCLSEITRLVSGVFDDFKKANIIIEYIARKTSYAINNEYNQNASAVFCDNVAQCTGYAKALQLALEHVNIPAILVQGEGNGEKHAWNIIGINGKYYHVDVTFLDGINNNSNDLRIKQYLFYTDDMMRKNHKWKKEEYPVCDDASLVNKLNINNNQIDNSMKVFNNLNDLRLSIIDTLNKRIPILEFDMQLSNFTDKEKDRYVQNTIQKAVNSCNVAVGVSCAKGSYYQIKFEYLE